MIRPMSPIRRLLGTVGISFRALLHELLEVLGEVLVHLEHGYLVPPAKHGL